MNLHDYNPKDLIGLRCSIKLQLNNNNLTIQGIMRDMILVKGISDGLGHKGIHDANEYTAGGPSRTSNCWWVHRERVDLLEEPKIKEDPNNLFKFSEL
jgi:hypothetical protein